MPKPLPVLTELETYLNDILSDGLKHSFKEVKDLIMIHVDNDPEFTKDNVHKTVQRLKLKLEILEPQTIIANTTEGRKFFWRKYRRLNSSS